MQKEYNDLIEVLSIIELIRSSRQLQERFFISQKAAADLSKTIEKIIDVGGGGFRDKINETLKQEDKRMAETL